MSIGERVKELRESKGLTQDELRARVKISERALRDLETGETRNPSTATVKGLAAALGVAPELLLGNEPIERVTKGRVSGPKSAREAVVDADHYLQYLFKRAGLASEEQRLVAAAQLDKRFPQWSTVTPALVDLWLESYDSKRGRR